jgi:ABC-2 type transport system permease protein
MPATLLKPHLLGIKNRLCAEATRRFLGRDTIAAAILLVMVVSIYLASYVFLAKIRTHPDYDPLLIVRMLNISFLAFFMLLLFSNSIAALGYLFSAKDLPLLLSVPVSPVRIYFTRLIQVMLTSSWMFFFLIIPALAGAYRALSLPWLFIPVALCVLVLFVIIPAAAGAIIMTVFVNIVPPHRIRDLLVIGALMVVAAVMFVHYSERASVTPNQAKVDELVRYLHVVQEPQPLWLPSTWAGSALAGFIVNEPAGPLPLVLLLSSACGLTALGYVLFDLLFQRGWSISTQGSPTLSVHSSNWAEALGRVLIPFNSQFRALLYKEARMFIRDTTQSLQLVLLLMLTFVYLYNFRALRGGLNVSSELLAAWQVVLSLANTSFGACVVAAIATRFVFPSVSLEGRAYLIVRASPLTVEQLLRHKFWIWFWPMCFLSILLFVSGTWAIYASVSTVIASAVLAVALTVGIVGLGIGIGAAYAKFDWESPSQVTASLGSLVYMLLSLGLIIISIIPAVPIFVLTCVPNFTASMSDKDYLIMLLCSFFLVFYVNYVAARFALSAGVQRLKELES